MSAATVATTATVNSMLFRGGEVDKVGDVGDDTVVVGVDLIAACRLRRVLCPILPVARRLIKALYFQLAIAEARCCECVPRVLVLTKNALTDEPRKNSC